MTSTGGGSRPIPIDRCRQAMDVAARNGYAVDLQPIGDVNRCLDGLFK
jgi:hypothetical protein